QADQRGADTTGRVPAHRHHIEPMSPAGILSPLDLPPPSARHIPQPSRGDGWNVLADVKVFVFAVEANWRPWTANGLACIAAGASRT
ncbi:hypothetical protein, partial [Roseicella aerolata]